MIVSPAPGRAVARPRSAALNTVWLGRMGYSPALVLQRRVHAARVAGKLPDTVLLLEHDHVITRGRRGVAADVLTPPEVLKDLGVEVADTDRGGQTTYHGPGQLVGYPIVDLKAAGLGPVTYVRLLEQTIIETLEEFGVEGHRVEGQTGVWCAGGKIAAIGVRISSSVTTHGFALNVTTDLDFFAHIVPCGMPASPVASVLSQTGDRCSLDDVGAAWSNRFASALGARESRIDPPAIFPA